MNNQSISMRIGVVVIGRNEGERLIACLKSVCNDGQPVVYVDSGSTDGSPGAARNLGADLVQLDMSTPFTAARARNAGFERLVEMDRVDAVQFVDGDCVIIDGWLDAGAAFLHMNENVAAVCGRLRERRPEASVYNSFADKEWDTPIGEAEACGGVAMIRTEAFRAVGGYDVTLIAGEEPEMCVRLREADWTIHRIADDMALHDINMTSWRQWWRRTKRAGHAFAEVSSMHKDSPKRIWAGETRRALFWAGVAPIAILAAVFIHPLSMAALGIYPLQILRLARRHQGDNALVHAVLLVCGKFAEAQGVASFWINRLSGKRQAPIEHKSKG